MPKICFNKSVLDLYQGGYNVNEAIQAVFGDEIRSRVEANPALAQLTPMNHVMRDAGITRHSKLGDIMNTAQYTSGGIETNQWLFPAWIETTLREAVYSKDIIQYLCKTSIPIDGNTVQSPYIDLMNEANKKAIKKARVAEGADLPISRISMGQSSITLWKYGRAIELTYETARRMNIELFNKHMQAIIADVAQQNKERAIDVAMRGDGNNNAATSIGNIPANFTGADLDNALIDYFIANNFDADTLVTNAANYKKIRALIYNADYMPGASNRLTFNFPQVGVQNCNVLLTDALPQVGGKDIILLLNSNQTLVRYEENGSNIQENQNFARNQTNLLTVSENSGYAISLLNSNRYITIG